MTRAQLDLAFLLSPACTYHSEKARVSIWEEEHAALIKAWGAKHYRVKNHIKDAPPARTEAERFALLEKLARNAYTGPDMSMHAGDAFRADLLVKAMNRPGYWTPEAARKRMLEYAPTPGISERVR